MATISTSNSLIAGVQKALMETWRQEFPKYEEMQKAFLHFLPYTTIRNAQYAFKDRVPMPSPWPYGKGRVHQSFQDRKIDINLFPFSITMGWDERDATDDQMGDLITHVGQGMERFLQLPDIMIGEYMSGVASYNYNGLNLAYDGVNLYSTVDGDGSPRFGVTGGNIITGSGTSSNAKILSDILACRRRFLQFKEAVTGQPLHNPKNITYGNMRFVIPAELDAMFSQIAEQELIYSDPSINTAQSNLVKGKIKYDVNQRLTDANDWFVVVETNYWKPFAYRSPQTVRQIMATMQNSDIARDTAEEMAFLDLRLGLAPWCSFTTIKVSNS